MFRSIRYLERHKTKLCIYVFMLQHQMTHTHIGASSDDPGTGRLGSLVQTAAKDTLELGSQLKVG